MTPPEKPVLTPSDAPRPGGPVLTLREAATATGLSLSTLRRRRADLVAHGARVTPSGAWEVPYSALIALGMAPRVTPPDAAHHDAPVDAPVTPPADELQRLADRVRELEHQLEVERVINRERERTIEAQQLALRAIERAPMPVSVPDAPAVQPVEDVPAPKTEQPVMETPAPKRTWRTLFSR